MLLCILSYPSWKIVINNIYRPRNALVSSVFPNAVDYFILKNFPERVVILVQKIFESERFWD